MNPQLCADCVNGPKLRSLMGRMLFLQVSERRSHIRKSDRPRSLRLMRQHRQRRLQAMREVAGLRDGACDSPQAQARMENAVYGYINLDTLAQLGEEPYHDQLKIVVSGARFDETRVRNVTADVRQLIESRGHQVRRVDIPEPGKHPHSSVMGLLLLAMSSFGLFALLLSGILVVNLLTALMASQIRQIGVMKTLGGTRRQIAGIYFGQALLLGVAALLVALPVGLWGSRVLCRYFAVFLNFDITSFAVPLWVYLLVAAVGLVVPLRVFV